MLRFTVRQLTLNYLRIKITNCQGDNNNNIINNIIHQHIHLFSQVANIWLIWRNNLNQVVYYILCIYNFPSLLVLITHKVRKYWVFHLFALVFSCMAPTRLNQQASLFNFAHSWEKLNTLLVTAFCRANRGNKVRTKRSR